MTEWPTVELDPIARLRVMARTLPGVFMEERVLDAPLDDVWNLVTDFETWVPQFDSDVDAVRILGQGERGPRIRAYGRLLGRRFGLDIDVELERGWCWMPSPYYVVGMGAVAEGGRTRFGHLEGVPLGGPPLVQRMLLPVAWASRFRHSRHVPRDVDGIERCLASRG